MIHETRTCRSGSATGGSARACLAATLAAALLLPMGSIAMAAGMGQARVESYINQPLDMRIPLHGVTADDLDRLRVELAPAEHYRDAGISPPDLGDEVHVEIITDDEGMPHARVTSRDPVREPFLRLLIQLQSDQQRLVRDFTVLLDPPPAAYAEADEPVRDEEPATLAREAGETDGPAAETVTEPATETAPGPATARAGDVYGPVPRGMSLWQLAESVQPPDTSIYQTMIAIHQANPAGFADGRVDRLRAGVMLDIPDGETIASVSRSDAVQAYQHQITGEEPAPEQQIAQAPVETTGQADEPDRGVTPPAEIEAPAAAELQLLADIWPIDGPMPVAENGGAAGIEPVESRLEQILQRLGSLEEQVAGGQEQTGESLAVQTESLERLESRMQGIESRLDAVTADAAARSGNIPMLTAGLIGGVAFLVGLLLGILGTRRREGADASGPRVEVSISGREEPSLLQRLFNRKAAASGSRHDGADVGRQSRLARLNPFRRSQDTTATGATVGAAAATSAPAKGVSTSASTQPRPEAEISREKAEESESYGPFGDDGRTTPQVGAMPNAGPVDADDGETATVPATADADDGSGESRRDSGSASSDPDDPVNMADMYLAEDLPAEAADVMRMAIESSGPAAAPHHWWIKQLECLQAAGDDSQFIETARRFNEQVDNPETWNEITRLGLAIDPENPLFTDAPETTQDDAPDWPQATVEETVGEKAAGEDLPEVEEEREFAVADDHDFDPDAPEERAAGTFADDEVSTEFQEAPEEPQSATNESWQGMSSGELAVEPADAEWFDDPANALPDDEPAQRTDGAPVDEAETPPSMTGQPAAEDDALEFDLDDMPDLEHARPVHGGAPSEDNDSPAPELEESTLPDADDESYELSDAPMEDAEDYEEIELSAAMDESTSEEVEREVPREAEAAFDETDESEAETGDAFELDASLLDEMADDASAETTQPAAEAPEESSDFPELDDSFLDDGDKFPEDRQISPTLGGPGDDPVGANLDEELASLDDEQLVSEEDNSSAASGHSEDVDPDDDEASDAPRQASQG